MPDLRKVNAKFYKPYFTVLDHFRYTGINILDETNILMFKFKYLHIITLVMCLFMSTCHWYFLVDKLFAGSDLLVLSADLSFCFNSVEAIFLFSYFCIFKYRMQKFVFKLEKEWRDDSTLLPHVVSLKYKQMNYCDRGNYIYLKCIEIYRYFYMGYPVLEMLIKKYLFRQQAVFSPFLHFTMPFEFKDNIFKFFCVYMLEYYEVVILVVMLNCSVIILMVTMNQLNILFILLQEDFKEIIQSNDKDIDMKLKLTIQRHSILTGLLGEFGSAFGAFFAVHLLFSTLSVCFYAIAAKINTTLDDFKNVVVAILISGNTFYSCVQGQNVTESALNVAAAIYESPWEDLSIKNRKMMLLTMIRSQQASYINSTYFINICTDTFLKIMKMSWSLISLVSIVYEK